MKSIYRVYLDFAVVEYQVRRLRNMAGTEQSIAEDSLSSIIRQLSDNWEGENGDDFRGKCQVLQGKIREQATDFNKIADTVDRMARNARDAELEAIRIARTKSGGGSSGGGGGSW